MEADPFARARVLLEQNRYDLAEREVRARIGQAADDPEGYILLSLCLSARRDPAGLDAAKRAVELAPDDARAHFAMSRAQMTRSDLDAAEASLLRAIELQPWQPDFHGNLAAIKLGKYDWKAALEAADTGLAFDPENNTCLNNRAAALTKLGRHNEAARTLDDGLENNPEDAFSHANRGWSLLHENERKAIVHFRESLRLAPGLEWAKLGMLEALRAKNWFYRRVLQFFLWLSRFSPRVQMALMLGIYIVVRMVGWLGREMPEFVPYVNAVILLYLAFVAAAWFAPHAMNLVLLTSRDGRMLLEPEKRWVSAICMLFLFAALGLAAFGLLTPEERLIPFAALAFLVGVHIGSVFAIPAGRYRWYGIGVSALVLVFAFNLTIEESELIEQRARFRGQIEAFERADAAAKPEILATLPGEEAKRRKANLLREDGLLSLSASILRESDFRLDMQRNLFIVVGLGALILHGMWRMRAHRAGFTA